MTGDTVSAALKKHNGYYLTQEQLALLSAKFREINGDGPFKPGMVVIIPIMNFSA